MRKGEGQGHHYDWNTSYSSGFFSSSEGSCSGGGGSDEGMKGTPTPPPPPSSTSPAPIICLWSNTAAQHSEFKYEGGFFAKLTPSYSSSLKLKFPKRQINRMRWFYEKKEIRNSPSIQAGLDLDTESRYRREGARFIIDIGSSMNLSLTTMATGVVYFHRFYMFHTFQDFPRYPTALACLFLAGKIEETPKKCKDMLKVARELLGDDKWATFGGDIHQKSEEIMTLERIILQTIKFDLHVEHPYTFLLKYAKCLKGDKARLQKMVQMAWTFVNDSLCTTLCLQWEPEIIAIALMHLAGKLSKFEVCDWVGRTPDHCRWWDMFVEDMTIELLEDICHQVLDLYSQTQNQQQTDSPPPPNRSNNAAPPIPPLPPGAPQLPASVPPPPVPNSKTNAPPPPTPPMSYPGGTAPPPQPFMYGVPPPGHMIPPNYAYPPPQAAIPPGHRPPGNPPLPTTAYAPAPPLPQQYYPPPPLPTQQPPPPPK